MHRGDCDLCLEPNEKEDMVQCDSCKVWLHFGCAQVDADVQNRFWECAKCLKKSTIQNDADVTVGDSENASNKTLLMNKDTKSVRSKRSNRSRARSIGLELKMLEEKRIMDEKLLEEKKLLLNEQSAKQALYLEQKFALLKQHEEEETDGASSVTTYHRTAKWVQKSSVQFIKELEPPKPAENVTPQVQATPRKVLERPLPVFSGRSDEWPIFISTNENSTRMCRYSNDENLLRLQTALKGKAYEAVKYQLLHPKEVPEVIETLSFIFGRPEYIIEDLIKKAKAEPSPRMERLESIISYALVVKNLTRSMEASKLAEYLNSPTLLKELVDKLPSSMKLEWAMSFPIQYRPNIKDLGEWLQRRAQAATKVTRYAVEGDKKEKRPGYVHAHTKGNHELESEPTKQLVQGKCYACEQNHRLVDCELFAKMSCNEKWKVVNEKALCVCLKHPRKFKCREQKGCSVGGCKANHHRLLHNLLREQKNTDIKVCNAHQRDDQEAWFRIIPVILHGKEKQIETYAFLDSGSSLTLLEEKIAKALDLEGDSKPLCLKWTANTTRLEESSQVVPLVISGQDKEKKYALQDVRTVSSLDLPIQSLQPENLLKKYPHLKGLPLPSYTKAQCGILIGLNNESLSLALKIREGTWNQPVAIQTRLGWCLSGGNTSNNNNQGVYHIYKSCECDESLHEIVNSYFALEENGIGKEKLESADDIRAKELLVSGTRRVGDRFECGLLWKNDVINMPESYQMALKRLCCLERKITKDPTIVASINDQIQSLLEKGYAKRCDKKDLNELHPKTWYLPIFVVKNPNKPNKQRLVWDAAAVSNGVSLNSMLHKGPDQLKSLPDVLHGFRSNKIAIAGDIQEMFHQVLVKREDQCSQRFLWRQGETNRKPDVYEMQVLTFGASCSPSIAQYVKNLNAKEFADKYPRAAEAILERHYVDDLLDSVGTPEEAIQLAKDIRYVHSKAGFNIRNWVSNSSEVLQALGQPLPTNGKTLDSVNNNYTLTKVLGLWWKPGDDVFTFSLKFIKTQHDILTGVKMPTKRELLRLLMSIFDPLGFLAFYLIRIKVLLQEVWRAKIDWDEIIDGQIEQKWDTWRRLLPKVENIRIPRCYSGMVSKENINIQLHVFVDASEDAMAAVAYLRFCDGISTEVVIVGAKSKVAPLQPMSIPRMELQAALIGSRLAKKLSESHKFKLEKRVLWTDSQNVLHWLRSDAKQYKQFVMFRVGEIQEHTTRKEWRWVPTKLNVADEATKWTKVPSFDQNSRWLRGPSFLYETEDRWPEEISTSPEVSLKEETRPKYLLVLDNVNIDASPLINANRFSKWERLHRSVAYVIRFVTNCRKKKKKLPLMSGSLSAEELQLAEVVLFKMVQKMEYEDDIILLKSEKKLPKSSQLYKCSSYFDEDGILRMKGRIDYAEFAEESLRRPVLLPRKNRVSFLILDFYHRKYKHSSAETVINEARKRYYIPGLRSLAKFVRSSCFRCKLRRASPRCPEMAPLPKARLGAFHRPFTFVGVDYFGPITVNVGRSTVKRWGVLFTCLTVRAIHIEVAHSLTADSCILSIRNFMARRGTPNEIYSDNGTNFVGADKELKEAIKSIHLEDVAEKFTTTDLKWFFNPPSAPHMGGSWERLVGSVKKILTDVLQNQRLTDEILLSTLIEIEGIVNSRPLTSLPIDDESDEALTPNHFLLGSSDGSRLPGEFQNQDLISRKGWRKCQQISNIFWKRWVREYLPTLTRRTKWFDKVETVKTGDVVIIVDENLPRYSWPKGIVISTITSKDGQVRRASVRTANGVYDRPVVKLAVLDVDNDLKSEEPGS